jgi:hypothetical protein
MLSDLIGKMIAPILSGQLELTLAKVIKLALGVSALRGPVVGFPFSGTVQITHLALRQFSGCGHFFGAVSVRHQSTFLGNSQTNLPLLLQREKLANVSLVA